MLKPALGARLLKSAHAQCQYGSRCRILANSAYAYTVVKWLGVAYLAWIGYRTLTAEDIEFAEPATQPQSLRRILIQGVVLNVLNPKVAIFFLAFLPQFVDSTSPNPAFQTFVLGMTLVIIGLLSDSIYAIIGGGLGDLFRRRLGAARATRLTAGFTYVALAGIAAVAGGRTK